MFTDIKGEQSSLPSLEGMVGMLPRTSGTRGKTREHNSDGKCEGCVSCEAGVMFGSDRIWTYQEGGERSSLADSYRLSSPEHMPEVRGDLRWLEPNRRF